MIVLDSTDATTFGTVSIGANSYYEPIELENGDYMLPDGAESLVIDRELTYVKRTVDPSEYKVYDS